MLKMFVVKFLQEFWQFLHIQMSWFMSQCRADSRCLEPCINMEIKTQPRTDSLFFPNNFNLNIHSACLTGNPWQITDKWQPGESFMHLEFQSRFYWNIFEKMEITGWVKSTFTNYEFWVWSLQLKEKT